MRKLPPRRRPTSGLRQIFGRALAFGSTGVAQTPSNGSNRHPSPKVTRNASRLLRTLALSAAVGGVAIAGTPGPAVADTGAQEFYVVKIGTNTGTVVARGVVTGAGREENNRLAVPRGAPFEVRFSFPQGEVFQTITPVGMPVVDFDPTTCLSQITISDTTEITGGTGAYAGATGAGVATAHLTTIRGRNADGSCLPPTASPIFEMTRVVATGTMSVG